MNIGILTARLPSQDTGGAEHQALTLALLLSERHQVTVLSRTRKIPQAIAASPGCTMQVRRVVDLPGLRFLSDVVSTLLLVRKSRDRLDVLIAYQSFVDGFLGALAKLFYRIPLVVSVRAEREYRLERDVRSRVFTPFVLRKADVVAVQTDRVKRELLSALVESSHAKLSAQVEPKVRIVPNGIAPVAPASGGGDVLFVGRLVEAKGVRHLIEAMTKCPGQRLVVVGDGPERGPLEAAASSVSNVRFAGRVARERLDEYYQNAGVLVLPSLRDEGMPNAIMEAMARGIPVIATRNAGIPDLVEDGVTGFLVEPGDSAGIAHHVRTISSDGALRARLGAEGRKRMQQYQWPVILETVEKVLREVETSA